LLPRRRNHVHLSSDTATAARVGARHGAPVVLTVKAGEMFERNFLFYCSANRVWLTAHVPPEFLGVPDLFFKRKG
jgi:putative RNA 2'-phosphotransferase